MVVASTSRAGPYSAVPHYQHHLARTLLQVTVVFIAELQGLIPPHCKSPPWSRPRQASLTFKPQLPWVVLRVVILPPLCWTKSSHATTLSRLCASIAPTAAAYTDSEPPPALGASLRRPILVVLAGVPKLPFWPFRRRVTSAVDCRYHEPPPAL